MIIMEKLSLSVLSMGKELDLSQMERKEQGQENLLITRAGVLLSH